MKFLEFTNVIRDNVSDKLGEEYTVEIRHVYKNNSVKLCGLVISKNTMRVSASIYLNSFYEEYKKGSSIVNITNNIVEAYKSEINDRLKVYEKFVLADSYEIAKNNIVARIINKDMNEVLLKDTPHLKFLDLAIIFYYIVEESDTDTTSVRITDSIIKMWDVDREVFFEEAMNNTVRRYPEKVIDMADMLRNITGHSDTSDSGYMADNSYIGGLGVEYESINDIMFVITNMTGNYGAVCMLYNGVIQNLATELDDDIVIIPSSVHEVLCVKKEDIGNPSSIVKTVKDVNDNFVDIEERLSYNVYIYSKANNEFSVYSGEESAK